MINSVQTILNKIPKDLINIIEEYNVNHRPLMRKVLQELTKKSDKCNYCKILVEEPYIGLYIYTWNRHKNIYCSSECCEAGDRGVLKARSKWLHRLNQL